MHIAIFSDVHANLPALEATLADIAAAGVDAGYALGDLVGSAPGPNETLERLAAEGLPIVMGNYDDGTGFERDECGSAFINPNEKALGDAGFASTVALALAVGAGSTIAVQLICLHQAPGDSGLAPLLVGRSVSATVFVGTLFAIRRRIDATPLPMALSLGSGVLSALANLAFLLAVRAGELVEQREGDCRGHAVPDSPGERRARPVRAEHGEQQEVHNETGGSPGRHHEQHVCAAGRQPACKVGAAERQ
jgi:hypothetical protein